jgi:hypothetical protein
MELMIAFILFAALVVCWVVLPAVPSKKVTTEESAPIGSVQLTPQ